VEAIMLRYPGINFATIVGALILGAFVVSAVRAALLFHQGIEQGLGIRQKSDLQGIFSKEQ
jgi:hypothetical protein